MKIEDLRVGMKFRNTQSCFKDAVFTIKKIEWGRVTVLVTGGNYDTATYTDPVEWFTDPDTYVPIKSVNRNGANK